MGRTLEEVKRLEDAASEATIIAKGARQALQQGCEHPIPTLVVVPYRPMHWGGALPPFRVCTLCGYAEDEWGCGSWKLGPNFYGDIPVVTFDEGMTHVSGPIHGNSPPERFGRKG